MGVSGCLVGVCFRSHFFPPIVPLLQNDRAFVIATVVSFTLPYSFRKKKIQYLPKNYGKETSKIAWTDDPSTFIMRLWNDSSLPPWTRETSSSLTALPLSERWIVLKKSTSFPTRWVVKRFKMTMIMMFVSFNVSLTCGVNT